jgi:hypothetical protein
MRNASIDGPILSSDGLRTSSTDARKALSRVRIKIDERGRFELSIEEKFYRRFEFGSADLVSDYCTRSLSTQTMPFIFFEVANVVLSTELFSAETRHKGSDNSQLSIPSAWWRQPKSADLAARQPCRNLSLTRPRICRETTPHKSRTFLQTNDLVGEIVSVKASWNRAN